ncbi:Putative multicopper oxidase, second cupredoxin domain-containing protein [Colletotrichum destructivum]|uniref:Multicopper oxidase, second cupredoxin domain-containing protein n=1 Tax=Colletotrichum destructivum TaxID=34406 RepID=A0AAX4IZ96_9PEZI|nr:Putative multicopper oxidase, second cupredoxin domain-containing protein [Colletotrichum destructivum]
MHQRSLLGCLALLLPVFVSGVPSPRNSVEKRQDCVFDSALNPSCWDGTHDLSTNWYEEAPKTGVVREYWFDVTNTTMAPDGVERMVLSINGSVPGPTIIADWGDTVVVHVKNSLQNNGTSIHFHGIRQNYTNEADGVASITQCPTAPGDSITYTWHASQYGSSWYHSHFALQAWNGVFGGIIVRGPASAPYDEDLGTIILSDWFHRTTDELYEDAASAGPPRAQTGLINGVGKYGDLGSRFTTAFESGKSYRMRLVNAAIDTHWKFMIDNHTLEVISADFVPINPYSVSDVSIGIGQRYDVVVRANQAAGDYWLRAIPQLACSDNENTLDIKGVVRYDPSSTSDPTGEVPTYMDTCADELMSNLVPVVAIEAGQQSYDDTLTVGLQVIASQFKWTLNANTFLSDWDYPSKWPPSVIRSCHMLTWETAAIEQVLEGNDTYSVQQNIVQLNEANVWVHFIIQNPIGLTHPIHLHGHDFWVLAQGSGTYDSSVALQTVNAPRRDVAMLPASGYLVIGFYTDNPGVWLMHCHIGWHTSLGFALQLIERPAEIAALTNADTVNSTCANWRAYAEAESVYQEDSGV